MTVNLGRYLVWQLAEMKTFWFYSMDSFRWLTHLQKLPGLQTSV